MSNQVINAMSTVITNINTTNDTNRTALNECLHRREKIILAILTYYEILKTDDQTKSTISYNECTLEAFRPFFNKVATDKDMLTLFTELVRNYKRKDGLTGEIIKKTWEQIKADKKTFLPARF